jgi:phosphoglycolate phosphatase
VNYIFDFDGTLADTFDDLIAVFNKNIRGDDNPLTAEEIEKFRGMGARRALRQAGIRWWQLPKLLIMGMAELKTMQRSDNTFKNIPETIKALHARGDKLFIVTVMTNTESGVHNFLKRHGIDEFFTDIDTTAGIFKKSKHIRKLIKKYGLKRRETVYVGDETRDIQAARMSLIKIVSVTWGFNNKKILKKRWPNFIINKPKELLEIKL